MNLDKPINLSDYERVVFFTGAGMSAECGVPTYRGRGGIWHEYNYEDYACQRAFDHDPNRVMDFHEMRRAKVLECNPHIGHWRLSEFQAAHPSLKIVTQNIDGMHQRAGATSVVELHGSLWRLRCPTHGDRKDLEAGNYTRRSCELCSAPLRPDITWFEDAVDPHVFNLARTLILGCDLFVVIGCSGVVRPASALIFEGAKMAKTSVEINTETCNLLGHFTKILAMEASIAIPQAFVLL